MRRLISPTLFSSYNLCSIFVLSAVDVVKEFFFNKILTVFQNTIINVLRVSRLTKFSLIDC